MLARFERVCFNVVALIRARLAGRDINAEVQRLRALPKARSYGEVGIVLCCLFGCTVLATSIGAWALFLLFLGVFLLFR